LHERLSSADDDPRPEAALRDLRALLRAFEELAEQRSELIALQVLVEVRAKVHQLFDESVHSFEQTLKLYDMAQELQAPAAHKDTAHYQQWRDTVAPMMAQPRSSHTYVNAFPDNTGW
jgi:hypothetical protein